MQKYAVLDKIMSIISILKNEVHNVQNITRLKVTLYRKEQIIRKD